MTVINKKIVWNWKLIVLNIGRPHEKLLVGVWGCKKQAREKAKEKKKPTQAKKARRARGGINKFNYVSYNN